MKSLAGFLLLFIMLFNLTGISLVFTFQKARLRREMKAHIRKQIPKEDLHKLTFHASAGEHVHWIRKGKELMFKGDMYDVVFSETAGDSIHYYCVNDHEETKLFDQLDEMVKNKMKEERRTGKNAGKVLRALASLVYIPAEDQLTFGNSISRIRHFSSCDAKPSAPYLEYITPPPRFS